jgi:DNA repair exonuclease SbcCD ATPase subunit
MSEPRLVAIELEGFRGFAKRQRLSLDADAVLIRGDNGSGKTSLVDGLLWLFCGELEYLAERVRQLRRTEGVVQSRFTDVPARVALELDHDGSRYVFERTGDERSPQMEARRDGKALAGAELAFAELFGHPTSASLHTAFLTWGLLRQDAVRAALDVAGGALHERLAGIVGLADVSAFADAASETAKGLLAQRTAHRKATAALGERYQDAADRHRTAQRELAAERDGLALRDRLKAAVKRLSPGLVVDVPDPLALDDLADLGRELGAAAAALEDLASRRQTLAEAPVEAAAREVEDAGRELALAQHQLATIRERGPASVRLAHAALDVLDADVCPVCGQEVNKADLRAHLEEILRDADRLLASAQQATDALARAGARLTQATERQRQRREHEAQEQRAATAAKDALAALARRGLRTDAAIPDEPSGVAALASTFGAVVDELRSVYRAGAAEAGGAHLKRLAGEATALGEEVASAQRQLGELETRYEHSKVLERAAHAAAERIVAHALEQLEPSFAEVFDRLNPNPAFTELRARQDVLRNVNQVVPIVHDPHRGIDANPLLVFSEGQSNVVALSYFLGMALNARDAMLPFLILDDPLQALDTVAVLGFGDLCRRIRDQRQLLVTTHDRRFADILTRKLSPREVGVTTIVHEFEGWTREGPSVRTTTPELAEVIPLLERRAS